MYFGNGAHRAMTDADWMSQGKCKDLAPSLFFPNDGEGVKAAQRICSTCPVKLPCLAYALSHRVGDGVWGGTSERQRRRLLRDRTITSGGHQQILRELASQS